MGDPAGIGPEVVLKAVAEDEVRKVCVPVIIGDAQLLAHTARTLDLQSGYDIVRREESFPDELSEPVIFHLDNISGFIEPGIESGAAGKAAAGYIEAAVELCAAGSIDAIATAPINKRALFLGGYSFPGHTEFLAHLTGAEEYAMAFVAANLRIVLLSTHVPLSQAIRMVERDRLVQGDQSGKPGAAALGHGTSETCSGCPQSSRRRRRTVWDGRSVRDSSCN
jgi:4-hydroxythreonine-4-phosphate dehydrogenase